MTGSKRREELINTIKSSTSPISGKTLAQLYDVSRQVIVQDIALVPQVMTLSLLIVDTF